MGVYFLFEALLGIFSIFADFGLRGAVEKRISEGSVAENILGSAIALKILPMSIVIGGILLFKPVINGYIGDNVAGLLALALVAQEAAQLAVFVLKGELRVGETAVLKIVRQGTWFTVAVVLVSYGFEATGLIWGVIGGLGAMAIWGWFKSSITPGVPTKEHAWSLIDYGKYNVVSSLGGYFYSWMDVAIIGLFLTQSSVGAYESAWRISMVVMLLSRSIATTVFPQMSYWDAEQATEKVEKLVKEVTLPSMVLVIPSFFGTIVFSREILRLLYGPEFTIAWLVLIVLMGEKMFQSIHVILGRALKGINQPKLAAYATVTAVVANLALNLVLIHILGIVGAAIATAISFLINTLIHGYYLSRYIDIQLPIREIGWCIVASTTMALFLAALKNYIRINGLPHLMFVITLGAFIYALIVMMNPTMRRKIHHVRRAD